MVSRVACLENTQSESLGFPENTRQGATALPTSMKSPLFAHGSFGRVILQERQAGKKLFLTADGLPTQLATTLSTTVSTHAANAPIASDEPKPVVAHGKAGRLMSKEEADKVKEAIARATSIEEVRRLERSLKEGFLPTMEAVGA